MEGENPPANPFYRAETHKWPVQSSLIGGATGVVRVKSGDSPEGVGVQLVAPNAVRTTVYTDAAGKFEFPKMQAGSYTLRIATPVPFKPYRRDSVSIEGATKLPDIVGLPRLGVAAQRRRDLVEPSRHDGRKSDVIEKLLRVLLLAADFPWS